MDDTLFRRLTDLAADMEREELAAAVILYCLAGMLRGAQQGAIRELSDHCADISRRAIAMIERQRAVARN